MFYYRILSQTLNIEVIDSLLLTIYNIYVLNIEMKNHPNMIYTEIQDIVSKVSSLI